MQRKFFTSIAVVLMLGAHASAQARLKSEFTSTAPKNSVVLEQSKGDEPDYFKYLCPGFAGYKIIYEGGDSRSWINLKVGGSVVDLSAATLKLAPGYFPNKANDVVEWRGTISKGKFIPYAIIYRLAGSHESGRKERTRLIVIKLDGTHSSIAGYAEGADEETKAVKLADRYSPR